ncbi:hypothetical protein PV05_05846 [Exophiala xenobiotica]|uniref:Zn(2)-C6 fungal-type domain-containing protein n=1 Tax=Exophiala xenobiotica TaxID=348802 RepID=A0A0D2FB36_9EURO|nr:uncharacterized protein PV05_05846 [Exophiala xenobiotica]KIW57274.1 hypothetical protein PV05_05846 [Exophiala xenobiotica]
MQAEVDESERFAPGGHTAQGQFGASTETLNMPGLVQQTNSSPAVQDMDAEGQALSAADKKRNKLGYHRTAVACGHCRRRKIRCVLAFDDPAGRCQNCLRLRKDCQFYPVDQQNPTPGKRARSSTKSEGLFNEGDASVASSSPGGVLRSNSFERIDQGEGLEYPSPFDHHQQQHGHVVTPSPYLNDSPRHYPTESMSSGYYPHYGNAPSGPYSSVFATGSLPSTMTTMSRESAYRYPTAHSNEAFNWGHPPARSMSGSESEEMQHGFPAAYRSHTYPTVERRMTADLQQMPPASHSLMPAGLDNPQGSIPPSFREPASYQPVHVDMQHGWTGGGPGQAPQLTGSTTTAYSQGWYPNASGVTDNREEEGHPHILLSQSHDPRAIQHKPG